MTHKPLRGKDYAATPEVLKYANPTTYQQERNLTAATLKARAAGTIGRRCKECGVNCSDFDPEQGEYCGDPPNCDAEPDPFFD